LLAQWSRYTENRAPKEKLCFALTVDRGWNQTSALIVDFSARIPLQINRRRKIPSGNAWETR